MYTKIRDARLRYPTNLRLGHKLGLYWVLGIWKTLLHVVTSVTHSPQAGYRVGESLRIKPNLAQKGAVQQPPLSIWVGQSEDCAVGQQFSQRLK